LKGGTPSLKPNKIIPIAQRKLLPSPEKFPQLLISPTPGQSDSVPITECKKAESPDEIFIMKTPPINQNTLSDDGTRAN
jgi:hypothetical protein